MDKQNVVYSCNGILFSDKRECSTDTRWNIDDPYKYYAKWKKPDTSSHILYESVYMKYPEQENP